MNKLSEVGNEASQTFAELESPARRLFVKGMAGLGAAFASASLASAAAPTQSQASQTAPLATRSLPLKVGGGLLLHRAVQADTCNSSIRRQLLQGSCSLASHTPFGSPMVSRQCGL